MSSLLLGRGIVASCSKLVALPACSSQQRFAGGRPWSARKAKLKPPPRPADLKPLTLLAELEAPLDANDPMRFLKIEAARTDGTLTAYKDPFIERFTNIIMLQGKKSIARALMEETLERIKRHQVKLWLAAPLSERRGIECDPRNVFRIAVKNASPMLQLRPVMKGGVEYQVPRDVTPRMAEFRALQWFRDVCREKWIDVKMHYPENLANEIIAAFNNEGRVIGMKRELHKQCEANRAYAHYRSQQ